VLKVLQDLKGLRVHRALLVAKVQQVVREQLDLLLVQQTKSSIRMAQTTPLVVLVLHMTEQILLLVGKSVLPHQRVMKVENFS
jgi:hypothetical protein